MKKIFIITIGLIALINLSFGQIPNPSFEIWTEQHPEGWRAYWNSPYSPYTFETISENSHNGSIAVKSDIVLTGPYYNPSGLYSANETTDFYFPVSQKPLELKGWFILQTNGLDTLTVNVTMKSSGTIVGQGEFLTSTTNLTFSEFTANINYSASTIPDSMKIVITFNHGTPWSGHSGSYFIIDDLSFGFVDGVNEIQQDQSIIIAQNTVSETISIKSSRIEKINSVEFFNSFGQTIKIISPVTEFENINVSEFPHGVYLYRILNSDNIWTTGKFIKQ
jgi:hypothetical protein